MMKMRLTSRLSVTIGRGLSSSVIPGVGGTASSALESSLKNSTVKSMKRSFGIANGTPPRLSNGVSGLSSCIVLQPL